VLGMGRYSFTKGMSFFSREEIIAYQGNSLATMKDAINMATRSEELNEVFSVTKQISDFFHVDEDNGLWAVYFSQDLWSQEKVLRRLVQLQLQLI